MAERDSATARLANPKFQAPNSKQIPNPKPYRGKIISLYAPWWDHLEGYVDLDALRADYEALQQQQRSGGIDFHSARRRNVWSLTGFAKGFARLLGRKAGVSDLSTR